MKAIVKGILCTSILTVPVAAETERELGTHEHGGALINVVLADSTVFIELETPWMNLVGFEHAPSTEAQHESVENSLEMLNRPDTLFSFVGANCGPGTVALLDNSMNSSEEHHEEHGKHDDAHGDGHHDEHDQKHDDAHGEEHHDEHGDGHSDDDASGHDDGHHDHDDHHEDEGSHSELRVSYEFACADSWPEAVNIDLFASWAGFEEIDVQLAGPGGQTAAEVVPADPLIDLSKVR